MGCMQYVNKVVNFKRGMLLDWHNLDYTPTPPVNASFYWMGYETMTFLENMGFVTTLLLVLAVR